VFQDILASARLALADIQVSVRVVSRDIVEPLAFLALAATQELAQAALADIPVSARLVSRGTAEPEQAVFLDTAVRLAHQALVDILA
jgi:hypothetical protein